MADLLIRNVDDETKRLLAQRAAANGRSVQGELLKIVRDAVNPEPCSWTAMLRQSAERVDGMEFEPPQRHHPRFTAIELEG